MTDRQYEDARACARRSQQLGRPIPYCGFAAAMVLRDYEGIVRALQRSQDQNPEVGALIRAYEAKGPRGLAEARVQWFLRQPNADYAHPVEIAEMHALLGNRDEAFAWLEKGFERRATRISSFHIYPIFDGVRDDPRFADLAHRIGIPPAALESSRPPAAPSS